VAQTLQGLFVMVSPDAPSSADSVPDATLDPTILVLLAAFIGFLDVRDADRAAQLWDVPALILGDTQVHGLMSIDRLADWLRGIDDGPENNAPPSYDVPGAAPVARSEPLVQRVEWASNRVAMVDASWPRRPRGGVLAGTAGTTFLVRVDQHGQAKIRGLLLRTGDARPGPTLTSTDG
jgi:hypothetical protein